MLEGRIAVICDGSPMVLTVPYLFVEDLGRLDYAASDRRTRIDGNAFAVIENQRIAVGEIFHRRSYTRNLDDYRPCC